MRLLPLALLLPACHPGNDTDGDAPSPLSGWSACGGLECATLTVPVADDVPGTFDLAVVRAAATDPSARIGVLVLAFGGPGFSNVDGFEDKVAWIEQATPSVRERFDLVAFDARGAGESRPAISCGDDAIDALRRTPWTATTEDEKAARADAVRSYQDGCVAGTDEGLLEHAGTLDGVDDLERLRVALGEDRLSLFTQSYSTILGALYADEHPDRVRALVLDGVASFFAGDPFAGPKAQEEVLDELFATCAQYRDCGLWVPGGADAVGRAYDDFAAEIARSPLDADPPVTVDELGMTAAGATYSADLWQPWTDDLLAAHQGDAQPLADFAGSFWSVGTHAFDAYQVTYGLDSDETGVTLDDVDAAGDAALAVAPRTGRAALPFSMAGAGWPVAPTRPVEPVGPSDAPPYLVVGVTHDPATPYGQAEDLAERVDNGSWLVTCDGYGHTAVFTHSPCATALAEAYLVDPTATPERLDCGSE